MSEWYGIYGIWIENELVYVGKTSCSFKKRFSEHKSGMKYQGGILYEGMRKAKKKNLKIEMKIICGFDRDKDDFSQKELSCMEYSLITYLQPKFNREGVVKAYRF